MDGEFVVEEMAGIGKGVGGGNFIIQSRDSTSGLSAASFAASAIAEIDGCITPFPGGIARSGSKVGSRYKNLIASTSESYCPSLRGRVDSKLHDEAICAYEIVIDAVDEPTVRRAMRTGIQALIASSGAGDIVRIGAGNYGGKLGKCLISLPSLFETG